MCILIEPTAYDWCFGNIKNKTISRICANTATQLFALQALQIYDSVWKMRGIQCSIKKTILNHLIQCRYGYYPSSKKIGLFCPNYVQYKNSRRLTGSGTKKYAITVHNIIIMFHDTLSWFHLAIYHKYDSKFVLNPEHPVLKFVFAFDSRGDTHSSKDHHLQQLRKCPMQSFFCIIVF